MKPYLTIWRDGAGHPISHQIIVASSLLGLMSFAERMPARPGIHASFHLLHRSPETVAAISLAAELPQLAPLMAMPDDATLFWVMQEDREAQIIDRPIVKRWAFVNAARWQDAQDLAEKLWPNAGHERSRGPALIYSADSSIHHLRDWDAPITRWDPLFPTFAPAAPEYDKEIE